MIRRKVRRPNHRFAAPTVRVRHSRLRRKHRLHVFVTDRGSQFKSSQVKSGDLVKATNYCTAQLHRTVVYGKLANDARLVLAAFGEPRGRDCALDLDGERPLRRDRESRRRLRAPWGGGGGGEGGGGGGGDGGVGGGGCGGDWNPERLGSRNPAACRLHERVRRAASRPGPSRTG